MRPRWRRAAGHFVTVVTAAAVVGACGVPADEQPLLDDPAAVPFGLLDPAPEPTEVEPEPPEEGEEPDDAGERVTVYLVSADQRLVPVERALPEPAGFEELLAVLTGGPTTEESAAGLRSAIPTADLLRFGELTGGVATVDLSEEVQTLDGTDQLLAIAQVVFTLTSRPGVGRVVFTLEGGPVEVPRGDGSLTSGSVSRDSYRELIEPAPTPTTTTAPAPT